MSKEKEVQAYFLKKRWTLALAESCTGGALASRLTAISGASGYFLGSIVAYCNEMKSSLLGVDPLILQREGAVSSAVAQQMWKGLMEKMPATYGIAVTGIAGPSGGSLEKPVGTVWCAIGRRGSTPLLLCLSTGEERGEIIRRTCEILLDRLYEMIKTE